MWSDDASLIDELSSLPTYTQLNTLRLPSYRPPPRNFCMGCHVPQVVPVPFRSMAVLQHRSILQARISFHDHCSVKKLGLEWGLVTGFG